MQEDKNKSYPSSIDNLKEVFESYLKRNIILLGERNALRDACEYALLNGGKRIRPLIAMTISQALNNGCDVLEACLSVEYFHTASLIADDLPCMDNDDLRRSKTALHKKFGEATALLASYALMSSGYEKIFQNVQVLSKQKKPFSDRASQTCVVALHLATHCAGISGAIGGQFKDLYPQQATLDEAFDLIYKKTITLFEISFAFGWIFGGGDLGKINQLKDVAYHFGLAFQIADDLEDSDQDQSLNICHLIGRNKSRAMFYDEINTFTLKMKKIELLTPAFWEIIDLLISYVKMGSS